MERDYVTPEQIEKARAVSLLDYLRQNEASNLVSTAPGEYRLKDHDSLKISNGKFHWFSRGIGGTNAIDYLVKVRGIEFKNAVRELAGDGAFITYSTDKRTPPEKPMPKAEGRFFMLPEANTDNSEAIAYLKGRGITAAVINDCIQKGLLYQNTRQACVFVGFDSQGTVKFASERGIYSDMKKDVAGSNKAFNFCMKPNDGNTHDHLQAERLYVFESAIDCMSHASITQIGNTDWDGYRLSLGGVSGLALNAFLENNPQISTMYFCLDNDKAGKDATERIIRDLLENKKYSNINIYIAPPPIGKDYNDTLSAMQKILQERSHQAEKSAAHEGQKPPIDKKRAETVL
jgi:hypothetical protein